MTGQERTSIPLCLYIVLLSSTKHVQCSCVYSDNDIVQCSAGLVAFPSSLPEGTKSLYASGTSSNKNNIPKLTESMLSGLSELSHLILSHSEIHFIEDGSFSNTKLLHLDLSHNLLTDVSENVFRGLDHLSSLDLTNNFGLQIHLNAFRHVPKLKNLYIGELNLTSINNIGLQHILKLQTLDVHANNLNRIDISVILHMTSLRSLDISGNRVKGMPNNTLSKFKNLRNIQVENNPWDCNCEIYWMRNLPNNAGKKVICKTPKSVEGLIATELSLSNLTCVPGRVTGLKNCKISYQQDFNTTLKIRCIFEGNPYPEVSWIRPDGAKIEYFNYKYPGYSVSEYGMLTISQLDRVDNGKWKMVVSNILREFSIPITVTVTNILEEKTTLQTTMTTTPPKTTIMITTPLQTTTSTTTPSSTTTMIMTENPLQTTSPGTTTMKTSLLKTTTTLTTSFQKTTTFPQTTLMVNTSPQTTLTMTTIPPEPTTKMTTTSLTTTTSLQTKTSARTTVSFPARASNGLSNDTKETSGARRTTKKQNVSTMHTEEQGGHLTKDREYDAMEIIIYVIAILGGIIILTIIIVVSGICFCVKMYRNQQLREIFELKRRSGSSCNVYEIPDSTSSSEIYLNEVL